MPLSQADRYAMARCLGLIHVVIKTQTACEWCPTGMRIVPKGMVWGDRWWPKQPWRFVNSLLKTSYEKRWKIAYLRAASLPFANTRIFSVCLSCFFNMGRMAFPWCRECRAGWPRRLSGLAFWARANAVLSVFSKKTRRGSKAKMGCEWLDEPFAPAIYLGQHRVSS